MTDASPIDEEMGYSKSLAVQFAFVESFYYSAIPLVLSLFPVLVRYLYSPFIQPADTSHTTSH